MHPREEMSVAFLADNPGRWMLHCHMLEHQMAGMSAYFEVI
jgi:FtsP/CotA-like multicopper oxidase with cupredoxin domain